MQRLLLKCSPARAAIAPLGLLLAGWFLASPTVAQPANDNFAAATVLTGGWGSLTNDSTGATAEPGEPNHAGLPASASLWYQWTAPISGEVSMDTLNSSIDTVLAVYTGSNVAFLTQVAANDDMSPATTNIIISGLFGYQLPFAGPSSLRFNATAGTTYYFAVDGKFGTSGQFNLNWAYHPGGMFRFASEDFDYNSLGRPGGPTGLPLYQQADTEGALYDHNESTLGTYYDYNVPGALVTVTRIGGGVGRVLVDYQTFDISAVGGQDYIPVSGTLVFDDFEMTKNIMVPLPNFPSFPPFFFNPPQVDPRNPDQEGLMFVDFGVALTNPRRDALETPDVSAPRVDDSFGTSIVRIWNTSVDGIFRNNLVTDTNNNTFFVGASNTVFNFAKAHFRAGEDVMDYWGHELLIPVSRGIASTNGAGDTINFRVLNILEGNLDNDELRNRFFPLQPESDYATPSPATVPPGAPLGILGTNSDFEYGPGGAYPGGGSLTWGQNDGLPKFIHLYITNDILTEFNEDIHLFLYKVVNNVVVPVGTVNEGCVTILYDDRDPPAGSVDEFHNPDFGLNMAPPVLTTPQQMARPGTDGIVYSLAGQPDGKAILGGNFVSYNTTPRNCIVRADATGALDPLFDPGNGANNFISSVTLLSSGQILVGGGFTSFNGVQRNSITRLNADGSLDGGFNPQVGANQAVWATQVDGNGQYLIAGEFTSYNGTNRLHIARLNTDGSLDRSFDPGPNGPDGTVWAMALQTDGRILIGGDFTHIGGQAIGGIARLNTDGSLDTSFNPGLGTDGIVYALNYRQDGRIWVGGEFTRINTTQVNRFARLNVNGSVDTTFSPGVGPDDTVYSIVGLPGGTVYVGGSFTSFNGTHRMGFTRLFQDGTVDTGFLDTAYNQFAGLHRVHFNDPAGIVFTSSVLPSGNVMIGGSFTQVGGGQADINIQWDPTYASATNNLWVEPKARTGVRNRSNVASLVGGLTPGPGNISLLYNNYSVNRQQSFLYISLLRTNGYLGYLGANFSVQPGLAQAGADYTYNAVPPIYPLAWPSDRTRSDGMYQTNGLPVDSFGRQYNYVPNAGVLVSTLNTTSRGNKDSSLQLANPTLADTFFLGGANIPLGGALGRSQAPFTIVDDDHRPGVLSFASTNFTVAENGTNAVITVIRTNGSFGSVFATYATSNSTAIANTDYKATTGLLSFGNGQTNKTFTIPIINNTLVQPQERLVQLRLLTPGGGATLGLSNSLLSIVDDDYPLGFLNFTSDSYVTNETSGIVVLTVTRTGGNHGAVSAVAMTTNGTAISGVNYVGVTNLLQWNDGDASPRTITVPLIANGLVGPDTSFQVVLSNPIGFSTNAPTMLAGLRPRTTVTIVDDNHYGILGFSAPSYTVNENGGFATITVVRTGGSAQSVTVNYGTSDGTAVGAGPSPNYSPVSGTLTFGPGQVAQSFNVPLIDDGVVDPANPFFFTVSLSNSVPAGILAAQTVATVNIVDTESVNAPAGSPDTSFHPLAGFNGDIYSLALQNDGKIVAGGNFTVVNSASRNRVVRMNADSSLDVTFFSNQSGANGAVRAVLLQSDGRILTAGSFTSMDGVARNRVARLVGDGLLDTSFNPGSGADNTVFALAETFIGPNRELLVGGQFETFDGVPSPGLVRLNNDGSQDGNFNPAFSAGGTVYAIAVYPTNSVQGGKIIIAGDFNTINGVGRNGIARLNSDGTLDPTFNPGDGATNTVWALAIQFDGRVLVAGSFTNFNGRALSHIARLNVDGSVDANFNVGLGTDDTVDAITLQPDNRIVLAGQFTRASGVSRGRITRLLPDGSVDPFINFGLGADGAINAVAIQPDGMLVIGGGFTQYDGQDRSHLARIYGGAISGSGSFGFLAGDFQADENSTNVTITIRRRGGTQGAVSVNFATSDGTAIAGINYSNVSTTLQFPNGETLQSVAIPLRDDLAITTNLVANLSLSNPQPSGPGGPILGSQPTATLTIINDDSSVSFSSSVYARNENAVDGQATIHIVRQGSSRLTSTVEFLTITNGTARAYTNYIPITNIVTFNPGDSDAVVKVQLLHNPVAEGDKTVILELTNASNALLFAPYLATLTVIDVDRAPGQLSFTSTNYVVGEGDGSVPVTVVRSNGYTGIVTVQFRTIAGSATPGIKYISTNGVLTFLDGETSKTIYVPILQDDVPTGDQTFSVALTNATGGASLFSPTVANVTIIDNEVGIGFSSPIYAGLETAGSVTLSVQRVGPLGTTSVGYITTNGTALAATNYVATSGTLVFGPGETLKKFIVPVLHDPRVTGDLSFGVNLFLPNQSTPPAQLMAPSSASVVVLDSDPGVSFTNANFYGVKSGTNVLISVVRSNANTGIVTVNYATTNTPSDTAQPGVDYLPTSGLLTFSNGIALKSFSVPLLSNRFVQGDRTFSVYLFTNNFSLGGVQLLAPTNALVTITNDVAGLSFSSPTYRIPENGGAATITVLRTGYTNSLVTVSFSTTDGTGRALANYFPTNGVLTFTNGDTVKTFTVPTIDDGILAGDKTVLLTLASPVGNAVLVNPSAAVLTVGEFDGSLIVPAGQALVSESGPINGVIDPGENVSVLLALRNKSGTNTSQLVATLAQGNGITYAGGPQMQSYGQLVTNGPSVSRQFNFTASGTNGQTITATLLLRDGTATNLAVFNFAIGAATTAYSNAAAITIRDYTNALPYPSTISVNGLAGVVNKATVTVTNLNHTSPSDIDMLLVSPTGAKSLLMSKAGSGDVVKQATLTFDDGAPTYLPRSGQIVSGTNRPTSYFAIGAAPPFPLPAPPPPYDATLGVFAGANPNGNWSLFVIDDTSLDSGVISNGWSLHLTISGPVQAAADLGVAISTPVDTIIATSNLTFSITATNYGPGASTNVAVTDILPAGATFVSANGSSGTIVSNAAGTIIWTLGNLAKDTGAALALTVQPGTAGVISNAVTVSSDTSDLNPDDDLAFALVTVLSPTADVVLGLSGTPNPIEPDDLLTYAMTITNFGPATATGVGLTNTLPLTVSFVSATPATYELVGNVVTFTNLGDLPAGKGTSAAIVVRPIVGGTITDSAVCASGVVDPLKGNNFASVKTIVQAIAIGFTQAGQNLSLSWPISSTSYVLESSPALGPSAVWTPVTVPTPTQAGNEMSVTLPIGPGTQFFRLRAQ